MSYSDIQVTHIHITEGLSVALQSAFKPLTVLMIVLTFQAHTEMLLCGDQSELFLCVFAGVDDPQIYWSSYSKS